MTADFTGKVTCGRVKIFVDGVIESGTAAMLDYYTDKPGLRGDPIFDANSFAAAAIEADRRGLQIAVHAIGDAAVRIALDGYMAAQTANGRRDSRHRIEHIEMLDASDLPRFAELGVIASYQPLHAPQGESATTRSIGGIAVDSAGNVIVADFTSSTIRKITASGSVTTFAGLANIRGSGNGIGAASSFSSPRNIMVDRDDTIYVSDHANCLLRRISSTAEVTTIAGTPGLCKFVSGSAPSSINAPKGLVKFGNTLFFVAGNGVAEVANVP